MMNRLWNEAMQGVKGFSFKGQATGIRKTGQRRGDQLEGEASRSRQGVREVAKKTLFETRFRLGMAGQRDVERRE